MGVFDQSSNDVSNSPYSSTGNNHNGSNIDSPLRPGFNTGCFSGFGELFVHQLRALGDNVIATGRDAETKLAHLKDTGAAIVDLDVDGPEAEI